MIPRAVVQDVQRAEMRPRARVRRDGGEDAAQRGETVREDGGGVVRVERGRQDGRLEEGERRPGREALVGGGEEFAVVLKVAAPEVEGDVWRARGAGGR